MGSAAEIIDLAAYRRKRADASAPAPVALRLPLVYVPVFAYVPVLVVSGYR